MKLLGKVLGVNWRKSAIPKSLREGRTLIILAEICEIFAEVLGEELYPKLLTHQKGGPKSPFWFRRLD